MVLHPAADGFGGSAQVGDHPAAGGRPTVARDRLRDVVVFLEVCPCFFEETAAAELGDGRLLASFNFSRCSATRFKRVH